MVEGDSTVDIESLRLSIDNELVAVEAVHLKELCTILAIDVGEKGVRLIRRMLQKFADSMDDEEDAKLSELLETIKDFRSKKTASKHADKLRSDDVKTTSDDDKHVDVKDKEKETSATHEESSGKRDLQTFYSFRKEFKIKGVIGEVGQKEGLSLVSLNRQVKEGKSRGYRDEDIINAIINAVSPNIHLRTVLESSPCLTLSKINVFLHSHFLEKNTTDLCQTLSCLTQDGSETAIDFVYKAMSLRQRIVLASKTPGAEISYDAGLVQKIFLKTVETGLKSTTVVNEVRPLLRQSGISDEELISSISQATQADMDRRQKQTKPAAKVNNVGADDGSAGNISRILSTLSEELISLKKEVREMKKTDHQKTNSQYKSNQRRPKPACDACKGSNVAFSCTHCAICQSPDHFARRCPNKTTTSSGNSKGLGN